MNEYYYLDAQNERKGPITKEELLSQNLDKETLVWREGLENWTPMKDIAELAEAISHKTPPPLPIKKSPPALPNTNGNYPKFEQEKESSKETIPSSTIQKTNIPSKKSDKTTIVIVLIVLGIIILGALGFGVARLYENNRRTTYENNSRNNESSNPAKYLEINNATVYGTGYLQCTISNNSSHSTYNTIKVQITYLDKDKIPIDNEYITLYNTISPYQTINVNQELPSHKTKRKSKYIETKIISAKVSSQN